MSSMRLFVLFVFLFSFQPKCEVSSSLFAEDPPIGEATLAWSALPNLPNELGVAGPFVGVHKDALIVAGGANFERPVWSTQKTWLSEIWVLTSSESNSKWSSAGNLPRPIGYGAAVSTPNGVVCIGGNDKNQNYQDVFLLEWDPNQQRVIHREFPPLPCAFAFGQATLVGDVIYVAGGQSGLQLDTAMKNFWSLDLAKQGDPKMFRWHEHPAMPTSPRAFNIVTRQHNGDEECVYVFGGRYQIDGSVKFLSDVWEFNPQTEAWRQRADLPRSVSAGTGIGFGKNQIFVLGGDDGSLFSRTDELKDQHPGFRKDAFTYNTITDTWKSAGKTPQNQVSTIPVVWNDGIVIASGEVRPRVRTPAVWAVRPIVKH